MIREDDADLVYRNEKAKFNALIDEIVEMQEAGRPVLVGTVSVEKSEMLGDAAQAARHQARGPQRQVPREGVGDRRPGRPGRRGHDRDEHGRPRHGHPARRQPGRPRLRALHKRGLNPAEVDKETYDAALAEAQGDHRGGPRARRRGRRPPHHRHRAPRLPADRQPAPRPRRPPGRPRLVALLPVARRRPDEALRQRARDRADGAPRARRGRGHRVAARVARRSRSPRPASRASTSTSASASSSSTTSSTSSARRSTPSATRSSTTRT